MSIFLVIEEFDSKLRLTDLVDKIEEVLQDDWLNRSKLPWDSHKMYPEEYSAFTNYCNKYVKEASNEELMLQFLDCVAFQSSEWCVRDIPELKFIEKELYTRLVDCGFLDKEHEVVQRILKHND